ncbi:MAG: fibronectin type III domain-containing protein [Bacteroidales bacterium]|nr:fibronectin type III domain-containing protein [Bacteroidales bacterium]
MKRQFILAFLLAACLAPMGLNAQSDSCAITLPWSENFDSYTTTGGISMPDCWTRFSPFQVNPGSNNALRPNLNTAYNHGNVLDFMGNGSSSQGTGTMKIATPLILAPLNAIELSFDVYNNGLQVFLATDTADESTYTLVGSYSNGYVWTTYEVRTDTLTGAPAEQGYIVFVGTYGTSGYSNARLDNLSVVSLNSCERPASVGVELVGPDNATVTWPEVDGAQSYIIKYSTVDAIDSAEQLTASEGSIVIDELLPGTQYYVWVQTVCDGGTSDPRTATFTTQLSCYAVSNLVQVGTGVDAASFQWELVGMGNAATSVVAVLHDETDTSVADIVEAAQSLTAHIFSGMDREHQYTVTLYTVCGNDTAEGVSAQVVFPNCGESPLSNGGNDKSASFPIAAGYDGGTSVMLYNADILFSMDTINGIALHRPTASGSTVTRTLNIYIGHTALDSLTSNPGNTGLTQVANGVNYTLALQEWDTLMFTTPFVYNGSSNVIVYIADVTGTHEIGTPAEWYWHSAETKTYYSTTYNGSSTSFTAYSRPDIRFVGQCNNDMTCEPPAVMLGEVDSTEAVVNWVGAIDVDYIVEYRQQGETVWTVADTLDADSYTLQGLDADTYYEVRVGIVCDTMVRYSPAVSFTTSCALMHLPFHFTQNNMSTVAEHGNSFSSCWSFSQYMYKGKLTNSHRGYVRNVDHNQWIMLPAIAEPISGARVRTWAASSDHGYIKVGVAEDGDISTVVWLDTMEVNQSNPDVSHDEYISYLDQYTGAGNRVVLSPIVNNDFHYIYFFDFHVEPIEDCMPARDLVLDSADASTLSFHWTPRGAAQQWAVYVDGNMVGVSNSSEYTATGLNAYTDYEVSVRSLCGEGDTADAVSETFRTGCEGDECYVTLVGHSSIGEGWYGAHLLVEADSTIMVENYTMLLGSDLSTEMRVCNGMTVSLTWLSGNDDGICSFELVNASGDTLFSVADGSTLTSGVIFETDSICTYDGSDTTIVEPVDTVYYTVTVNYDATRGMVTGAGTYAQGTAVTLTAIPFEGFRFGGWSNGATDSVLTFTLAANVSLTASFIENAGIASAEAADAVGIAPNPASTTVSISGIGRQASVTVVDGSGREVLRRDAVDDSTEIDVSGMARGVYFVRIVSGDINAVRKLIVR